MGGALLICLCIAGGEEFSSCDEWSLVSEDECSDDFDFEGLPPTKINRRLANNSALKMSLRSGRYPKWESFTGPYESMDPSSHSPLDYLHLLWPPYLVDIIVAETNNYANQKQANGWRDVNSDDVWTFLGIIVLMNINKVPKISDYWSRDPKVGNSKVRAHMPVRRFWAIWANLHVVDNATLEAGSGVTSKIKPVVDILRKTFFENYSPKREMSVDEAMVKYKGCVKRGKVKMSKKPIKCGFKVWCLACSCCGYLCNFEFYEGQPTDPLTGKKVPEKGLIRKVVEGLLEPFEGMGHVVYLDNYFTSGPLVESLRKKGIFTAGTIQQRAKGFPEELKKVRPPAGEFASAEVGKSKSGRIVYSVFNDRKVVSFVSNAFPPSMKGKVARLAPNSRVLRYQQVPPVLPAYNKYMGAVDRVSQTKKPYGFGRKSKRYWFGPFMACWDYAINNAYILYKHNCKRFGSKPMSLYEFRKALVDLLLKDCLCRQRASQCGSSLTDSLRLCRLVRLSDLHLKRGRCYRCLSKKRRGCGDGKVGFTVYGCAQCRVRLCKIDCFEDYHRHF